MIYKIRLSCRELETQSVTSIAKKFEILLELHRRPDGSMWGGQDLHNATGGVVTRSYITNLRKGRIENPGYDKLAAIAKAMGFSPKLWFEEPQESGTNAYAEAADDHQDLSDRVNHLFDTIRNEKTGEPYTNSEAARLSLGDLTEEEVEDIRTGSDPNPSMNKVIALADVFGVHPSYFLDRSKEPPTIDRELLDILRDETVSAIAHKSLHLPKRDKQTILGIIQQFEAMHDAHHDNGS